MSLNLDSLDIKTVSYNDIRPKLMTGWSVLWSGKNAVSKLIRLFSEFSHASLLVRINNYSSLENRVFLIEAISSGLRLTLMSERVKNYSSDIYLFKPEELDRTSSEAILYYALIECAKLKKYDYGSLFANIFGRVPLSAKSYFCSEFVWSCYLAASLTYKNEQAPRPDDIINWLPGTLYKLEVPAEKVKTTNTYIEEDIKC